MSNNEGVTLTEFLEARIAEDEALARAALAGMHGEHRDAWDYAGYVLGLDRDATPKQDEFITEWWPKRVLAECAAKRGILDAYTGSPSTFQILAHMASVYKDHPDYDQEWSV